MFDCPKGGIEVTSCTHNQDAGVFCIAGNYQAAVADNY